MLIRILLAAGVTYILATTVGCDSCGNPPAVVAPAANPAAFIGRWQLTIASAAAPINMTLGRAVNQTPTAPGDLSLEGTYGASRITGNANGAVFVGVVVYGNNATAIELNMVAPGQATGTYSSGMNARNVIGVRMTP